MKEDENNCLNVKVAVQQISNILTKKLPGSVKEVIKGIKLFLILFSMTSYDCLLPIHVWYLVKHFLLISVGCLGNSVAGNAKRLRKKCNPDFFRIIVLRSLEANWLILLILPHKEMIGEYQKQLTAAFCKKKLFLNISQYSQENLMLAFLLMQAFRLATLLKRDSNTEIFLWILRNF